MLLISLKEIKMIHHLAKIKAALALIMLALAYQNCAPEMDAPTDQSSQSAAAFAYSVTADHIAYMSCTDTSNATDFFTLKLGTYDTTTSGVSLRKEFREAISKYALSRRIEILNENPINRAAQIQVALRPATDFVGVTTVNGQPVFKNVLGLLNLSPIAPDLVF
jgi:hypothetical protein